MKRLALLFALAPLTAFSHPEEARQQARNLVEVAAEAGTFQTLLTAAKAAGLAETLATGGPFTVFAPTDEAFAKLPQDAVAALLRPENKDKLAEVLSFHVVSGSVDAADAIEAGTAQALTGGTLRFAIRDGRLRVNDATVIANDVAASNGVVHVIDSVLAPPSGLTPARTGRLIIGVYTSRPSAALCDQLDIERHGSLLITSISNANAREAGLQKYDVIVAIDGESASDAELKRAKARAGLGNPIELELFRKGRLIRLHVPVTVDRH